MWRSKKFIIIALLAIVVLAGSIGGIALANTGGGQPEVRCGAFLDEVCRIYNENTDPDINCEALQDAFAQARSEMRDGTLDNCGREALMARVAEILGIDQLALEDVCDQAWEAGGEMHPDGERPFKRFGRGPGGFYRCGEYAPQNG